MRTCVGGQGMCVHVWDDKACAYMCGTTRHVRTCVGRQGMCVHVWDDKACARGVACACVCMCGYMCVHACACVADGAEHLPVPVIMEAS